MEFRFIPLLVTLEINLLLGIFVLVRRRREVSARVFSALCFAVSIWCAVGIGYFLSADKDPWLKSALLGVLMIPAIYQYYLAEGYQLRRGFRRLPVLVLLAAFTFAAWIFPWKNLGLSESQAYIIGLAVVGLYLAFFYLAFFLGLRHLLRKTEHPEPLRQVRFEFWATALPFPALLLQAALNPVFPKFPASNLSLAVVLGAELVVYSFLRSGRVQADELLHEGMAYLAYLVLVSGIVALLLFLLDRIPGLDFTPAQFLIVLSLTALSTLLIAAARDQVRAFIERAFFPEKYEYHRRIERYEQELEQMQLRLQQVERLAVLGEMAAAVAHEIRNPLGPIKGYAQMFLSADMKNPPDPELMRKGLAIIAEEVKKIDERVESLLEFSRPAAPMREEVNLRRLVEQTAALFRFNPAFTPELKIRLEVEDGLTVLGDPAMLESAIYNLLLNAAQACGGKGSIRVKSERQPTRGAGRILLEVADDGPGLEPEVQARLFEPFFTRKRGGVGLGLCIVKRVVEEHHGAIEVQSEPGQGASFRIYLPEPMG
jgi:signal transduction histidine kinase